MTAPTVPMYLIDTSIFSYFLRSDPIIDRYAEDLTAGARLFLSVQTVGELRSGAAQRGWGEKRKVQLQRFLDTFTILPITEATATVYAEVTTASRRAGRRLQVADAWIMATAKQYGLTLVAHDQDMEIGHTLGVLVICRS